MLHGGPFHLVEVTLDPDFDRPPVLERYGKAFGADPAAWTLLTGNPQTVLDFAARFGVTVFPDQRAGLIHPARTVIIDPAGTVRQEIDQAGWAPESVVAASRAAANLSSNPLRRFDLWLSSAAVAMCGNAFGSFSGILDLAIVLAIFAAGGWVIYRVARGLFTAGA
jgi:hypothetical protein